MITIATVCGDPGGANAIVPVLQLLASEPNLRLLNFAYNEGQDVLGRHGIDFIGLVGASSTTRALSYLKEVRASYLLSATSLNSVNWERFFFAAAQQLTLPSLAILDFWCSYRERFADDYEAPLVTPSQIAVMDERAFEEAIAAGLPERCLVVTGQPAFDALSSCRKRFDAAAKRGQRASFEVEESGYLVMFISQPLREMHKVHGVNDPGFDEILVVEEVLLALEAIARYVECRISLLIRPHPRECCAKYEYLTSDYVRVFISDTGDPRNIAMAADLVVGMNSVLLFEACHLGCAVVSVQPGLHGEDSLPSNKIGASHAVYEKSFIREALSKYLLDVEARQSLLKQAACLRTDDSASRHIADLILNDLELSRDSLFGR